MIRYQSLETAVSFSSTLLAASPANRGYIRVGRGIMVTPKAVGLGEISHPGAFTNHSPEHIFMVRNWLKMIRICTDAISAQVIKFHASGYRSDVVLKREAVRT